jgi:hypothetical protein
MKGLLLNQREAAAVIIARYPSYRVLCHKDRSFDTQLLQKLVVPLLLLVPLLL